MNWFIPAFVSSRPDSGGGISDEDGDALVAALLEEAQERLADPVALHGRESTDGYAAGGSSRRGCSTTSPRSSRSRSSIAWRPSAIDSETSLARSMRPPWPRGRCSAGATFGLLAREPRRDDRAGRAGAEAEREPEDPSHRARPSSPAPLLLLLEPARGLPQPGADRDDLDERARRRPARQPESCETRYDLAGGRASRRRGRARGSSAPPSPDLAQQRHGLLADAVDHHLRALEDAERVEQHDAQEQDQQAPEGGQDDEGGVSAVEREDRHGVSLRGRWSGRAVSPRSIPTRTPARPASRLRFLALARRLVVALALEAHRPVLLLDHVAGVVVRVPVALAVAELLRARVARVAQVRAARGRRSTASSMRAAERGEHAVRLRRARQVDRGLRQVQPRLGQADVLDGLRGRDRDQQRPRVGEADVLARRARPSAGR